MSLNIIAMAVISQIHSELVDQGCNQMILIFFREGNDCNSLLNYLRGVAKMAVACWCT